MIDFSSDLLISIINFFIALSLIPSILTKDKPNIKTSACNILFACAFFYSYYLVDFTLAMLSNLFIGVCWLILFIQKLTKKELKA